MMSHLKVSYVHFTRRQVSGTASADLVLNDTKTVNIVSMVDCIAKQATICDYPGLNF